MDRFYLTEIGNDYLLLDCSCGNGGDCICELKIKKKVWEDIKNGKNMKRRGIGSYEGDRFWSYWTFKDGDVDIESLHSGTITDILKDIEENKSNDYGCYHLYRH